MLSVAAASFGQKVVLFTPAEQQQISIATPGIFAGGSSFTINLDAMTEADYSFPLPVGKATVVGGQSLNITTTKGDAVKAMFDGTVRLSRRNAQYGNVVVVRHDNGLETVYANNAQNLVKVGQRVKAGQTLAIVGGEGGKHWTLFAIMVNGGWINPNIVLDPASHRLRPSILKCEKMGSHVNVTTQKPDRTFIASLDPDDIVGDPFDANPTLKLNLQKLSDESWAYPLPGSHVISPYGGRRNHAGVDIKTKPNDNIVAAFDGVVTRSCPYSGYGNCIVIKHALGFETLYSHQNKNFVKVGDKVKAGQVIGTTGRTGRATTEHLHFEVKFRGRRLNPAVIFDHIGKKLQPSTLILSKGGSVKSTRNGKM